MLLLDAYCGVGGATAGYQRAGFTVVGVDHVNQRSYCGDEFFRADALTFIAEYADQFDAIHASPPCQLYSNLTTGTNQRSGRQHADLVPGTRDALNAWGGLWVMENVVGAPLRADLVLCGEMFGLDVIRHRLFELSGFAAAQPQHLPHRGLVAARNHGVNQEGPYVAVYGRGGDKGTLAQWSKAMGIDWAATRPELKDAIPPAYTQFIGEHLAAAVTQRKDATCPPS